MTLAKLWLNCRRSHYLRFNSRNGAIVPVFTNFGFCFCTSCSTKLLFINSRRSPYSSAYIKLKMDSENRVVVLIDMDCFYCQVEEKLNPELSGKPIAVVQYNPWKGGGIIAVNYVARAMGVTRHMRGDEAKAKCPEINLPSVPCSRGKADITKYRDAGKDVAKVLQRFTTLLERASIDEAYLDITAPVQQRLKSQSVHSISIDVLPNTYALGYDGVHDFLTDVHNGGSDSIEFDYENAKRLLVGAVIVNEIRTAVYEETGYQCSAGIAHNKILAKLVCGMNKPNKQTVLPKHSIDILYKTLPLKKVKHLGGKFGDTVCQILRINTMAELQMFSEKELQNKFDEKNGMWLFNIARGVDLEPVQAKFNPKSIGCCKQFRGKAALLDLDNVRKWLKDLGDEIEDRLEKDALESNRTPKQMVVSYSTRLNDGRDTSSSRSYNFTAENELCGDFFSTKAFELLMESSEGVKHTGKEKESNRRLKAPIEFLGISVGKFQDNAEEKKTKKINEYFGAGSKVMTEKPKDTEKRNVDNKNSKKDNDKEFILQRFFQTSEKGKETIDQNMISDSHLPVFESALDNQESFFAKMLNKTYDSDGKSIQSGSSHHNKAAKPYTPVCEVISCGEDSVDTEYSGSTINMEINKSIALFEDDPNEVDRIDNMRQLLTNSTKQPNNEQDTSSDSEANKPVKNSGTQESSNKFKIFNNAVTFNCSECMKAIPMTLVEMHADYHLALKLRDEERKQIRKEIRENRQTVNDDKKKGKPPETQEFTVREDINKGKSEEPSPKIDKAPSIKRFLVKLDDTIPTSICSECEKKIPTEKFSEHLDFHEAQKLSKELNGKPATLPSTQKRKRKSTPPTKKSKIPNCKSIDSFFK